MYPNLQQARSGETQHLNVSRKAINPSWSANLPQPRPNSRIRLDANAIIDG
jgi:hypothetical protein